MAMVAFTRIAASPLYASSASGDAGIDGYWAGYCFGASTGLVATATLADTWADTGGSYLFLRETPTEWSAFAAALATWLTGFAPAGTPRFVWLANPNAPSFSWQATVWHAVATITGGETRWTTWGVGRFALGDYRLTIAAGTALTLLSTEPAHAVIGAGGATLRSAAGAFEPTESSAIPFQGAAIGAWVGALAVPADGLRSLGVELCYAVRYARQPADPRLVPVAMPLLGTAAGAMTLDMRWDPLEPFLRGRTGMTFAASSPAIAATLVTQRGYATTLTPAAPDAPLWSAGLMFTHMATRIDQPADARGGLFGLAPDGAYTLNVVAPPGGAGTAYTDGLTLGLSGLESTALAAAGTLVVFDAGRPAFAPTAVADEAVPGDGATLLDDRATTAWMAVVPSASGAHGLAYYAQPRQSPLFVGSGTAVMEYQPIPAARLSGWKSGGTALPLFFPVGAYAGVAAGSVAAARALEQAALAPLRRSLITGGMPGVEDAVGDADIPAITPQGVMVTLKPDLSAIDTVVIANLPDAAEPRLAFTGIGTAFEAALFANQRFFVVSNPTAFLAQAACVPPFSLDLDGWAFHLDPARWRTGDAPTLMVWKYAGRSIEELAADSACWAWPAVASDAQGSVTPTWRLLNKIIRQAKQAGADAASPLARFYADVLADPAWNGVLFLNAPVGLADLPSPLRFVAAGLDPARFYAHHIGVGTTPIDSATQPITLKKSSVFGLIDYVDTVDLVPEATVPFAFKTMRLMARFANARLADFATTVEISLNRLFAAQLTKRNPTHGNNLLISGTLQRSGGVPSYAFSLTGENRYDALRSAMSAVEVTSVRVETLANPAPNRVVTSFALGGRLNFLAAPGFDLFGYGTVPAAVGGPPVFDGALTFAQLALTLEFDLSAPAVQHWRVDETGISFDLANSAARPDSLVACFPVVPRAVLSSPNLAPDGKPPSGLSPEDMGYLSISALALDQLPMVPPWYGLAMTLDLGSLGALAGGIGLKAEILAAWMPGKTDADPPVYLGLKLPGTPTRGGSLPLQGILKLGFKSFAFSTYQQDGKIAYLLRMSRFALSILGFSFPPGNFDVTLFGGPSGRSTGQLGWLAAYTDPDADKSDGDGLRRKRLGRLPIER